MQPLLVLGSSLKAAAPAVQVRVAEHQAASKMKMAYVWDGPGCDIVQVLPPDCWLVFTPRLGEETPPLYICRGESPVVAVAWLVRLDL